MLPRFSFCIVGGPRIGRKPSLGLGHDFEMSDLTLVLAYLCSSLCEKAEICAQFLDWCNDSVNGKNKDFWLALLRQKISNRYRACIQSIRIGKSLDTQGIDSTKFICDPSFIVLFPNWLLNELDRAMKFENDKEGDRKLIEIDDNVYRETMSRLALVCFSLVQKNLLSLRFPLEVLKKASTMDNVAPSSQYKMSDGLFGSMSSVRFFIQTFLSTLSPFFISFGPCFAFELCKSAHLRENSIIALDDLVIAFEEDSHYQMLATNANTTNLKVADTFLKPFRDDLDSRNEYKSPNENAIFNERERCFDEFCNLITRFQQINKSDLDGHKTQLFYLNDMIPNGSNVLNLHVHNSAWFSDMFVRLLLFHSLSSNRHTTQVSTLNCISPDIKNSTNEISKVKAPIMATYSYANAAASSTPIVAMRASSVATAPITSSSESVKGLNIPAKHLSKLEERLGSGGVDYQFNKPTTAKAARYVMNATPTSKSRISGNSLHYNNINNGQYDNVKGNYKANSINTSHSMSGKNKHKDEFESPSHQFPGCQQFFFRFIVHLNNHRFNQHLLTTISSTISSLIQEHDVNKMTSASTNKPLFAASPSVQPTAIDFSAEAASSSLSYDTFTVKVVKLKILGKFLGVLKFYHLWTQSQSEHTMQSDLSISANPNTTVPELSSPLSPLSLYAQEAAGLQSRDILKSSLPIASVILSSFSTDKLCITIPWVVEFLKMMNWSSQLRIANYQPYIDCFQLLREIQHHPMYHLIGNEKRRLSSNRLYCLIEIKALFECCEVDLWTDSVSLLRLPERTEYNDSNLSIETRLDDMNLCFTAPFLHHVVPSIEVFYLALRNENRRRETKIEPSSVISPNSLNVATKSNRESKHKNIVTRNKSNGKKRQAPSKLSTDTSEVNNISYSNTTMTIEKLETNLITSLPEDSVFSTPERSISADLRRSCSTMRSVNTESYVVNTGHCAATVSIPKREDTGGTISPSKRNKSVALSHSSGIIKEMGSVTSSPTPSTTAPFPLMNNSNVQLDSNALNSTDEREVLDRLENSFWTQHLQLQQMSQFLLSHTYQACLARIKEHVANVIRDFLKGVAALTCSDAQLVADITSFSTLSYNDVIANYENTTTLCNQSSLQKSFNLLVANGVMMINEFYADFIEQSLPKLYNLYPLDGRVVKMAVYLVKKQVNAQKQILLHHIKAYGYRKLNEAFDLIVRQSKKKATKTATIASNGENLSTDCGYSVELESKEALQKVVPNIPTSECSNFIEGIKITDDRSKQIFSSNNLSNDLRDSILRFQMLAVGVHEFFYVTLKDSDSFIRLDASKASFIRDSLSINSKLEYILCGEEGTRSEQSWVIRNKVASIQSFMFKLCCGASEVASSMGFNMVALVDELREKFHCTSCVNLVVMVENVLQVLEAFKRLVGLLMSASFSRRKSDNISGELSRVEVLLSQSLTESQWAIMRSKLSVDIVKFLSLASPMCLFLDCVLAVGRSVRADSEQEQQSNLIAVDCLQSYQSIGVLPSSLSSSLSLLCGEGTPLFFASDLLTQLVVMEVVSSASYTKVLVSTLKPKHTAAFESCRSLKGLQIGCHKAVLFAVGRYLQGLGLGLDLSRDGSSCWFWDLSVMSHLKSSLQDELFDFITDQIKRITS